MHEAVKWGEKLGVMEELFFSGESVCESILWRIGKIHFSEREEETEEKFLFIRKWE